MKHETIMLRIKANYETRSKTYLTRRIPVIMRIDGKAFHTYTRGLNRPFDQGLMEDMDLTAINLCKEIQGAKCAYVQSDEISILITDYDDLQTQAWFDYEVQKMVSISAGIAVGQFNKLRLNRELSDKWDQDKYNLDELLDEVVSKYTLANFDSRVFNIPKEEVANYFLARQKDAVKNSISSVAQSLYSHSELHQKNGNQQQEMIFQKGINWNDYSFGEKRGRFIIKRTYVEDILLDGDYLAEKDGEYLIYLDNQYNLLEKANNDYTVRTRWEVVETPMTFSENDFKKWTT